MLITTTLTSVATPVEKLFADALRLPPADRALIAEKLLASLAGRPAQQVERAHLAEIQQRRRATHAGKAKLIDGHHALRTARSALKK